jgi:hypothetical protein
MCTKVLVSPSPMPPDFSVNLPLLFASGSVLGILSFPVWEMIAGFALLICGVWLRMLSRDTSSHRTEHDKSS